MVIFKNIQIHRNANYIDFLCISVVSTSDFLSRDGKVSVVIHVAASIYFAVSVTVVFVWLMFVCKVSMLLG